MEAGEPGGECTVLLAGPDPPPARLGPCRTLWRPLARAEPIPGSTGALRALSGWADAYAFTSPRAARALAALDREGAREALSVGVVWAIGPSTARALREMLGLEARVPPSYTGRALGEAMASAGARRVVGVRSPGALPDLPETLASRGVAYAEVHVYRVTVEVPGEPPPPVDYAAATSPRIARALLEWGVEAPIVSIGPTTTRALREAGVEPACTAGEHTLTGLARCLHSLRGGSR